MSRLIDADALRDELLSWALVITNLNDVMRMIDEAPTVDAVPVVRCKDCRWYDKADWCTKLRMCGIKEFEEYWFCADGERREEDANH